MATFSQLPSGKWRVQVRRAGTYRAATFPSKAEARKWADIIEVQTHSIATTGYAPPPKDATLGDLIDKYVLDTCADAGKTKTATLAALKCRLGHVRLTKLSVVHMRDFIDQRQRDGAGGVTIAADLSFLSAVLKWGRHGRKLDIPAGLALEARAGLQYQGLSTRSHERKREPTDDELARLYAHWQGNDRQVIDVTTICRFALATGMRLGEITRIVGADVDRNKRTVVIRDRKDPKKKKGNDQTVPLLPDAWAIVAPLLDVAGGGFLFPVRAASVSTAFTRACQALDIEDLHFHDLRHRATAQFFRVGLNIPQVAVMTGHKTWAMLKRYTDIKPDDVHAAIARAAMDTKATKATKNKARTP